MANNSSSNKLVVPEARAALDKFKMEAANEVGVNLKEGYNGDGGTRRTAQAAPAPAVRQAASAVRWLKR